MAFKLDLNTRDLAIDNNKHVAIADKSHDIRQRLILKLELMKGEWFLDENEGIPWLEIFSLTGEEQEQRAKLEVRKVLNNDKAIVEIRKLEVKQDPQTAVLTIDFTVLCTDEKEYTIIIEKGGAQE